MRLKHAAYIILLWILAAAKQARPTDAAQAATLTLSGSRHQVYHKMLRCNMLLNHGRSS